MVKLLNCLACHDIVKLMRRKPRKCKCGKSEGQYSFEGVVTRTGPCRILTLKFSINP